MVVKVIGAGLAGCEAAWQIASRDIPVELYEMRPNKTTPAHSTANFAELVCSNSFRSADIENAVGLLNEEMRRSGSLIISIADETKVPAGSALAVDREIFSSTVTKRIKSHPLIKIVHEEYAHINCNEPTIIATGPLTSDAMTSAISDLTQKEYLAFFDALAPIVYRDSINFDTAWFQSRYDKGSGDDYINCPLNREQYYRFIDALLAGDKTEFKEWEKNTPYFNGCLPIEVMAARGPETLRFGPMKPVGLKDSRAQEKPYAVVQLRQDNKAGTLYNIVGFQTKLKYGEQMKIFRTIPGLENAEFARLGGLHRNTFINSPSLLNSQLSLLNHTNIKFAGQITGVEGYLESAAIGMLAGLFMTFQLRNLEVSLPPISTALGALLHHITNGAHKDVFQPMNINYGLFEPIENLKRSSNKKQIYSNKALENLKYWLNSINKMI